MGENVLFRPAREVEFRPRRQEAEARLREVQPVLAAKALLQPCLYRMEVKDIGSRVFELRLAEHGAAPIGGLLLLGQVDADQIARQVAEARAGPCRC